MLSSPDPMPDVFWMAGYECADHVNKFGDRVCLLQNTGHLSRLRQDYQDLQDAGIGAVREGICWSQVETAPYRYDWATVDQRIWAAQEKGVRIFWDLCHFGFPDDLSPLHPHFSKRFAALCGAFVLHYRQLLPGGTMYVTPINEISFLSWLGGDACGTVPFCVRQGWEVKYHLCKAFIAGVRAMRAIDDDILIVSTEPLINVVCESAGAEEQDAAAALNEQQFQSLDMLTGRDCPELGGHPSCVDIVGVNFYFNNQWSFSTRASLSWAPHNRDPGWKRLHLLLQEAHLRYGKPVLLSETSHTGEDRGLWMRHIAEECAAALRLGVPLTGICLYPIIDRPDWDFPRQWHRSGLWDEAELPAEGNPQRIVCLPYLQALQQAQRDIRIAGQEQLFIHSDNHSLVFPENLPFHAGLA